jgi:hypothetical protein
VSSIILGGFPGQSSARALTPHCPGNNVINPCQVVNRATFPYPYLISRDKIEWTASLLRSSVCCQGIGRQTGSPSGRIGDQSRDCLSGELSLCVRRSGLIRQCSIRSPGEEFLLRHILLNTSESRENLLNTFGWGRRRLNTGLVGPHNDSYR